MTNQFNAKVFSFMAGIILSFMLQPVAWGQSSADYSALPISSAESAPPLVMLLLASDQGLWRAAYDDYSDIDGDGNLDTGYDNSIDYRGYFDSDSCYDYDLISGRFEPQSAASNHQCSGSWSGNFLNWATMTRMDLLRMALYGGKRSDDPTTPAAGNVVLERALIPDDGHAFAKVVSGPELSLYTPFTYNALALPAITVCNATFRATGLFDGVTLSKDVNTSSYPPKMRIGNGSFPDWASTNGSQCAWGGSDGPSFLFQNLGENTVRVEACVAGVNSDNSDLCRTYDNGNVKPVGQLQRYGETGQMRFGLMTRSWSKHRAGGVLRKHISFLLNNSDSLLDEIDANTGVFINQGAQPAPNSDDAYPGIVATLDRFRISQWDFKNDRYDDCRSSGIRKSEYESELAGSAKECRDWGNPLSEMLMESLRYFSGQGAPSLIFNADDDSYIDGLPQLGWSDPMAVDEYCATCANVILSFTSNDFDGDDNALTSGVTGLSSAVTATASLAATEGISGSYLVGNNGVVGDGECNAQTVNASALGSANGQCDENPNHEGGWQMAGLAYHAATTDLRNDRELEQTVKTYAVDAATDRPTYVVPTSAGISNRLTFTPSCLAGTGISERQCSLLRVEVQSPLTASGGSLHVYWDDSAWGSDFDVDAVQQLEYCVGSACTPAISNNQIQFRSDVVRVNSASAMDFGYVLSGTTSDGSKRNLTVTAGQNPSSLGDAPAEITETWTASAASAITPLPEPLSLAAKYGNFQDFDLDGTPATSGDASDNTEWDTRDQLGNSLPDGDGIPDAFFKLESPKDLEAHIAQSLARIETDVNESKTGNVVLSQSTTFDKLVYQSYYYAQFQTFDESSNLDDSVDWVGGLHALFLDSDGNLREDNGIAGTLEAMTIDYAVRIFRNGDGELRFQRFSQLSPSEVPVGSDQPFEDLSTVWNARDELASISNVADQREYTEDASTGRYLFTWIDRDADGVVDDTSDSSTDEVIELTAERFPSAAASPPAEDVNNFRYLGVTDDTQGEKIVSWVRGEEVTGLRSRSIDYDGDAADEIWRLGDLVNSKPLLVQGAVADYDSRYSDDTYRAFRQKYEDRRQVLYVGGNDGLIHAFNAGKFSASSQSLSGDGHALGAELWAYAPMNLLPHLQWQTELDYPHVFYVDGSPRAYDVNIFTPDDTHPNGWGTILVVGMRLGGGDFALDTDGDLSNDMTMRSAYVILDITDPEQPPELIAEITDPGLGLTLSRPALVKRRQATASSFRSTASNEWLLVFGSGPDTLSSATSNQTSSWYAFDLVARDWVSVNSALQSAMSDTDRFFGDPAVIDWDNDFIDDMVYVGANGGTVEAPIGEVKRVVLSNSSNLGFATTATAATLVDVEKPVLSAPKLLIDQASGGRWALFGSGRYLVPDDKTTLAPQAYYGIREPTNSSGFTLGTVDPSDIEEVGEIETFPDSTIRNSDGTAVIIDTNVVETFGELISVLRGKGGWRIDFAVPAGKSAERNFTDTVLFGNVALFTTFQPDGAACDADGTGRLYGLHAFTGVAPPFSPLGTENNDFLQTVATKTIELGDGIPAAPEVFRTDTGKAMVMVQTSTGDMISTQLNDAPVPTGRQSWREIPVDESLFD